MGAATSLTSFSFSSSVKPPFLDSLSEPASFKLACEALAALFLSHREENERFSVGAVLTVDVIVAGGKRVMACGFSTSRAQGAETAVCGC